MSERLLSKAVDTFFEDAGNSAAYGVEISRQKVKNEIENLNLNKNFYEKESKKIMRF